MANSRLTKLRRHLDKIGYSLVKCGRGDRYGYMLYDREHKTIYDGGCHYDYFYGLTLDEVEDWLSNE